MPSRRTPPLKPRQAPRQIEKVVGPAEAAKVDEITENFLKQRGVPASLRGLTEEQIELLLTYAALTGQSPHIPISKALEWSKSKSSSAPAPTSPNVEHPEAQTHGRSMVEDDRIITKQGSRYFPISLAADIAQVPRTTLVDWIKARAKFQGRPLQTYDSPTAKKLYLTEESLQRVANRFIKWPSRQPAGPVTIGETDNQNGYVGIAKAARTIGVDHHTMWLWATQQGKAPTDKPPEVIKCSASDQFYIHEKDISRLKKFIPRSGLKRGRRPQLAPPIPKSSPPRLN